MKKLVYSLAVLFTVALVSCGGNKAAETDSVDTTAEAVEVVEEVATDSNDTTAAVAAEVVEAPAAETAAAN